MVKASRQVVIGLSRLLPLLSRVIRDPCVHLFCALNRHHPPQANLLSAFSDIQTAD